MKSSTKTLVQELASSVGSTADRSVPSLRRLRREASKRLKTRSAHDVIEVGEGLLRHRAHVPRWLVYELVHTHPEALASLDSETLNRLGDGMSAWGEVDSFACYLSGVAWREGQIPDVVVHEWARSPNRWWRRAAVVSSVPLNSMARGGYGDPERTLAICDLVRQDRDDMVVKACSWALRELAKCDAASVRTYIDRHESHLAPRIIREVRNKLETGLKSPRPRDD